MSSTIASSDALFCCRAFISDSLSSGSRSAAPVGNCVDNCREIRTTSARSIPIVSHLGRIALAHIVLSRVMASRRLGFRESSIDSSRMFRWSRPFRINRRAKLPWVDPLRHFPSRGPPDRPEANPRSRRRDWTQSVSVPILNELRASGVAAGMLTIKSDIGHGCLVQYSGFAGPVYHGVISALINIIRLTRAQANLSRSTLATPGVDSVRTCAGFLPV